MERLEELDLDQDSGAFNRSEDVALVVKGETRVVALSTEGWELALEEWKKNNEKPRPPYKEERVEPGSRLARRLRHKRGLAMVKVYDEKDPKYLAKVKDWGDRSNYFVAAHCLKLRLREGGQVITDTEKRAEKLRALGLTALQAQGICSLIFSISMLADKEDAEDFAEPSEPQSDSDE